MKKVIALVLSLAVSLMLFACAGGAPASTNASGTTGSASQASAQSATTEQTAFELYKNIVADMEAAESLTMDVTYDMTMDGPVSMNMAMDGQVVQKHASGNTELYMDLATSVVGQNLAMEAWYKDGNYYYSMMGMKIKTPLPIDQVKSQNNFSLLEFNESAIKDQKVTDAAGGGKELRFTIEGSKMTDIANQALKGNNAAAFDASSATIAMDDVQVSMIINKEGKVTSYSCAMSFSVDSAATGAVSTSISMSMPKISYAPATISFPADLDSYQELEA